MFTSVSFFSLRDRDLYSAAYRGKKQRNLRNEQQQLTLKHRASSSESSRGHPKERHFPTRSRSSRACVSRLLPAVNQRYIYISCSNRRTTGVLSRIRRTWCRCRKGVPRFGSVLCNVRLWAPIWIWHNSTCLRLGLPAKIHFISHSATQIKCCRARDSREFQGFRAEKCPSGWVLPRVLVVIARRGPDYSSNVCLSNCRDSVTVEGVLEFS